MVAPWSITAGVLLECCCAGCLDTSWWRHGGVLDAWTHPGGAMVNLDNGKLVSWSGGPWTPEHLIIVLLLLLMPAGLEVWNLEPVFFPHQHGTWKAGTCVFFLTNMEVLAGSLEPVFSCCLSKLNC